MVQIDRTRREASIDGVPLALGEREYELLSVIATIARKRRELEIPSVAELLRRYHFARK